MKANLQSVGTMIESNNVRDYKLAAVSILLYGTGEENSGLCAAIMDRGAPKEIFLQAKRANQSGYMRLCTALAVYIVISADAEQEGSEKTINYSSYEIPWNGIMELFLKSAIDGETPSPS